MPYSVRETHDCGVCHESRIKTLADGYIILLPSFTVLNQGLRTLLQEQRRPGERRGGGRHRRRIDTREARPKHGTGGGGGAVHGHAVQGGEGGGSGNGRRYSRHLWTQVSRESGSRVG